jgi:REP element-mobilizing transposase RayT
MCRGNRQEPVFKDQQDYKRFLDTLGETCGRCGWRVHAYVLMGNHYHLLLETPEANLVDGMRWFQGVYTQRFNARHKVWGHLFQGRYKALLVGSGSYFSTHCNPIG